MYLLKEFVYNNKNQLMLYHMNEKGWLLEEVYPLTYPNSFYKYVQTRQQNIEYAIIGINKTHRNILYYFYPHIKIIIDKEVMVKLFKLLVDPENTLYEEVAVSIEEEQNMPSLKNVNCFIEEFYHLKTKEEANEFYELWQMVVPINDKGISQFINIMENFLNEILNYFR